MVGEGGAELVVGGALIHALVGVGLLSSDDVDHQRS